MTFSTSWKRKLALTIGINNYPHGNKLDYCINDAQDVKAKLESINFHVTLGIDCTKDRFKRLIDVFVSQIQPQDLVLFYFAGHGNQFEEKNFLLPAGYSYNSSINQRQYIENNSINAQYILHEIETRQPYATIFILDCCRIHVKNRSQNNPQGSSGIRGSSECLIAFSCGFGQGAIDDSLNGRNGIFTGYLLKYLTKPDLDIATIIEKVTKDIKSKGFLLPWCSTCLTNKIYLAADNTEDLSADPLHLSSPGPNNSNVGGTLPRITPRSRSSSVVRKSPHLTVPLESIKPTQHGRISAETHTQRPSSVINHNRIFKIPSPSPLITALSSRLLDEERPSRISSPATIHSSESCHVQEQIYTSGESSGAESSNDTSDSDDSYTPRPNTQSSQRNRRNSKSNCTLAPSTYRDPLNKIECVVKEESTPFARPTPVQTCHENTTSSIAINNSEPPTIHVRSLCQSHRVKITNNTTMQDLINIIWREARFDMERYTRDAYVLLLFNHRLHIFVEGNSNTLVTGFLSLSPSLNLREKDSIDFYVYGLPRERAASMYNIDNGHASLFGNPDSWYPVHFINYKQSDRPQSTLLSSLYALRLYFRTDIQELKAERLAMEAQFFLHLRDYLFPPAILAFKHAIVGSMFRFEKPLLMDALIQLLNHLCDPNTIFAEEICDFIPLLFCWLLEMCDPNDEKGDHFLEVRLINPETKQHSFFRNPVTTSVEKRRILTLEEFDATRHYNVLQHHVDIRSLTLYLARPNNASPNFTCDEYVIYDPISYNQPVSPPAQYWTEADITELYKTMAQTRDYRSFSIITRGAITADIKNQLVLLNEGRTVALVFCQKNVTRPGGKTRQDIDHFFQIFNPLTCTKEKPHSLVASDTIIDEKEELPDPRLPIYFTSNLLIAQPSDDSKNDITSPAHQVTVILLDRSRSMSNYRIASSNTSESSTHIDICKMMLGRLSDNLLATNEIHAVGLIEFATKVKTICPITRKRDQFEEALSFDDCNRDWRWTCMHDAIREAIKQIKTFVDSPKRAIKDCKKLIICLSDGFNNSGSTTIANLHDLIKNNRIVIDFISFLRDDQLKKGEEAVQVQQFRKVCTNSGGYVYRNLSIRSDLELAAMFEEEAAVWLSKRSRASYGIIDKPECYVSPTFQKAAMRDPPENGNAIASPRLRRILSESRTILNDSPENFFVFVVPENIAFWKVILKGPVNSPYEGKFWMLYVEFDSNYPKCAPNVRFFTPIFHVNITGDGKICHQILNRSWCQQTKMKEIFENILDLLVKPNFDDAVSIEKAHLYKENPNDYRRQAKIHSNKYAQDDLEKMKLEYQLEDYDEQFEDDID